PLANLHQDTTNTRDFVLLPGEGQGIEWHQNAPKRALSVTTSDRTQGAGRTWHREAAGGAVELDGLAVSEVFAKRAACSLGCSLIHNFREFCAMPDLANLEHLEADLWDAADNLRANSKLTAGEY